MLCLKQLSIPAEEFQTRITTLRKEMATKNVDVVMIFGDEHKQGDVRYFSGYRPMLEFSSVIIPLERDPILLCGPECFTLACDTSIIKDVRMCRDLQIPGEEYPNVQMESLQDILIEVGLDRGIQRVGIPRSGMIPRFLFDAVQRSVGRAEIVDVTEIIDNLRAVKSHNEIDIIRRNYILASSGLRIGLDYVRPGLSETDLAAEMASYMWRRGPEQMSHIMMVASGRKTRAALSFPSDKRVVTEGDIVIMGIGVVYEGYFSDHSITTYVENVSKEVKRAMKVCWEAKEAAISAMRPGALGFEIDYAARQIVTKAGYGANCSYGVGHGVGLQHCEWPMLGPTSEIMLKPGMVFAIDVGLWELPFGGIRFEDGILVTETGIERLTTVDIHEFISF